METLTQKEISQKARFLQIARIADQINKLKKDYIMCIDNLSREDQHELEKINNGQPLVRL